MSGPAFNVDPDAFDRSFAEALQHSYSELLVAMIETRRIGDSSS